MTRSLKIIAAGVLLTLAYAVPQANAQHFQCDQPHGYYNSAVYGDRLWVLNVDGRLFIYDSHTGYIYHNNVMVAQRLAEGKVILVNPDGTPKPVANAVAPVQPAPVDGVVQPAPLSPTAPAVQPVAGSPAPAVPVTAPTAAPRTGAPVQGVQPAPATPNIPPVAPAQSTPANPAQPAPAVQPGPATPAAQPAPVVPQAPAATVGQPVADNSLAAMLGVWRATVKDALGRSTVVELDLQADNKATILLQKRGQQSEKLNRTFEIKDGSLVLADGASAPQVLGKLATATNEQIVLERPEGTLTFTRPSPSL